MRLPMDLQRLRQRAFIGPPRTQPVADDCSGQPGHPNPFRDTPCDPAQGQVPMHGRAFGRGERRLDRPASAQALAESTERQSQFPRPICEQLRSSLPFHEPVVPVITALLRHGRPSYIPRFIVSPGVGIAIQRVLGAWAFPHICTERREIGAPAITDGNPPCPVLLEPCVGWTVTAPDHPDPQLEQRRTCTAMLRVGLLRLFPFVTAARLGLAQSYVRPAGTDGSATDTGAVQHLLSRVARRGPYHRESSVHGSWDLLRSPVVRLLVSGHRHG